MGCDFIVFQSLHFSVHVDTHKLEFKHFLQISVLSNSSVDLRVPHDMICCRWLMRMIISRYDDTAIMDISLLVTYDISVCFQGWIRVDAFQNWCKPKLKLNTLWTSDSRLLYLCYTPELTRNVPNFCPMNVSCPPPYSAPPWRTTLFHEISVILKSFRKHDLSCLQVCVCRAARVSYFCETVLPSFKLKSLFPGLFHPRSKSPSESTLLI